MRSDIGEEREGEAVMKCEEIRERMLDVAAGLSEPTAQESNHLASCTACAEQLKSIRSTMSLLDEWQAPEPSPYFDVRLQARLREEMAKPQAGWLHWFRRPVLAAALTVIMGVGIGLFFTHNSGRVQPPVRPSIVRSREPLSATYRLWKKITTCTPISNCLTIWICSRMS